MKEIQDIVRAYSRHTAEGKQTALATVVHVEGSSYRRPGARMLVSEDGQLTGAISGGCLEGDALRKARLAMSQGIPALVKYDTMDDDDAKLGVGLGCNGIIHILIEPISQDQAQHPLTFLQKIISRREVAVVVTLFCLQDRKAPQPGTCLLYHADEEILTPALPDDFLDQIQADVREARQNQVSSTKSYKQAENTYTAFLEVIQPAPALVICGAGNDVMPLVNMAVLLGWPTTVIDGRGNYATVERFPQAQQVLVAKPERVLENLAVDQNTIFLLFTHNYNYDLAMLRLLLPLPLPYVGVLGPKTKMDRMLAELQEEGYPLPEAQLEKVFGPVGLDLGGETSEEIALSVLAEIKAVLAHRNAGFLREKQDSIHAHSPAPVPEILSTE
ncbi:XdhC family protein [Rufibacter sediminis]|uniref:XdhC family protein n=1 Tax=Rufibacter sediminis TaxID=2762756 RepID=A0ABR6VY72_9BACT|nr:XdhC/CoxI family protein [Rufibacter sediminis]MBC3541596.1 XdhC family protein [Rufibacter sediminis]